VRAPRIALAVLAGLATAGAGAAAAITQAAPSRSSQTQLPVTVPLTLNGAQGAASGAHPLIKVKVGNGPAVPVVLDTGSVGLHIYAPGVKTGRGGGVTRTQQPDSITYVDGTVQSGVIATAKITIGGVSTAKPIEFGLITKVGCVSATPNCPTSGGIGAAVKRGSYGVMGVRFESVKTGMPPSPLVNLPRPYSSSWSIAVSGSGGRLVLAARAPSKPTATLGLMSNGDVPVCWTVGPLAQVCEQTLFDSGEPGMVLYGGKLAQAPTTSGSREVQPGTRVSAAAAGSQTPFWSFSAGTTTSKNAVHVHAVRSAPSVNASVEAFFAFTLTWNAARRTISLSVSS